MLCLSIFLSCKNVFSEGFNDYIDSIRTSSETENAVGACKNVCPKSDYYQLTFGLPITNMSRCACVPLSQGVGGLLVGFTQFLLSSIGVLAVILIIVAGFMRAFSAGNPKTIEKTTEIMRNAFIGVVAVIFSGSALAIINPDLVNTGIFAVKISKIDVPCVDPKMAASDSDGKDKVFTTADRRTFNINCSGECKNNICNSITVGTVETKNGISEDIKSTTIDSSNATTSCRCDSDRNPSCIDLKNCKNNEVCITTFLSESVSDGLSFYYWKCFPKLDPGSACYQGLECKSGNCKLTNGNMTKFVEVTDSNGKKQKVQTAGGYCQ